MTYKRKANNWRTNYITIRTTSSILKKPKDKVNKDVVCSIGYRISYKICEKTYNGQTARALKTWMKEHYKALKIADKISLLQLNIHTRESDHNCALKNVEILNRYLQNGLRECFFNPGIPSVMKIRLINTYRSLGCIVCQPIVSYYLVIFLFLKLNLIMDTPLSESLPFLSYLFAIMPGYKLHIYINIYEEKLEAMPG